MQPSDIKGGRQRERRCNATAVLATAVLAAAALLAGCANNNGAQLSLRDSSAPVVAYRAAVPLADSRNGSLEAEFLAVRGTGAQSLQAGEQATLGSQVINGPADLQHEARLRQVQLAYNHRILTRGPLQVEAFGGLTLFRFDWATRTSGAAPPGQLNASFDFRGLGGGGIARWRLTDALWAEGRLSAAINRFPSYSRSRGGAEAVVAWNPLGPLVLRLGYTEQTAKFDERTRYESPTSFKTRGPFGSVALAFN